MLRWIEIRKNFSNRITLARERAVKFSRTLKNNVQKNKSCFFRKKTPIIYDGRQICFDRLSSDVAQIDWVRPFPRISERRFGWGDIQATKDEVVAADREEVEILATPPKRISAAVRSV